MRCKGWVLLPALVPAAAGGCGVNRGDPLPSWNDGVAKREILSFAKAVMREDSPGYVPPVDRVAAIDFDGTLICEKPLRLHVSFALHALREQAEQKPELRNMQPYQAAAASDREYLEQLDASEQLRLLFLPFAGLTFDEYAHRTEGFLSSFRHPRFAVPPRRLFYQPMLELAALLRDSGFRVFVVSESGDAFTRAAVAEVLDLAPESVIAPAPRLKLTRGAEGTTVELTEDSQDFPFTGVDKAAAFLRRTGRRPLVVCGDSDGDVELFQLAASKSRPSMAILVRHDDPEREYDYGEASRRAVQTARDRLWTVVSMKSDWRTVFAGN